MEFQNDGSIKQKQKAAPDIVRGGFLGMTGMPSETISRLKRKYRCGLQSY
jgi:hypothetical protein